MYNFEREFNSHEQYNKWQVISGMRVSEGGTKPSVYISELKLRKAFKRMDDEEIEILFGDEFNRIAMNYHRDLLNDKLDELYPWQLFRALAICLKTGALEAAQYVLLCQPGDVEPTDEFINS